MAEFVTKSELYKHRHAAHTVRNIKVDDWECKYCKLIFRTRKELFEHNKSCLERFKLPLASKGRVIPIYDRKAAESMIQYKKSLGVSIRANFSKKAYLYIDNLNKEKGWNLQHGLNGGEKQVGPYFVDDYDAERNIVFEYDEVAHHRNKKVEDRDIARQTYIIQVLDCEFWRYDEKSDTLYCVAEKSHIFSVG